MQNTEIKKKTLSLGQYRGIPAIVNLSESANSHILITGASGYGKTVMAQNLCIQLAKMGMSVLAFDCWDCLADDQIFHKYREDFNLLHQDVFVRQEGLGINLLTPIKRENYVETEADVVDGFVDIFSRFCLLGVKQKQSLRAATETVYRRKGYEVDGLGAIDDALESLATSAADSVRVNLASILRRKIFHAGDLRVDSGKINVLRISDYGEELQKQLVEIVLSYVWRLATAGIFKERPLFVFLDEIHKFVSGRRSIIATILREGRKFGVNLLCCTQNLDPSRGEILRTVSMSDTVLYFKPAQDWMGKTARTLCPDAARSMELVLRELQPGEFLSTGSVWIGNRQQDRPVKISNRLENRACMRDFSDN